MLILLLTFIVTAILQIFTPYFTRKSSVFGNSIPEPYIHHVSLQKMKKQYSYYVGGFTLLFALIQLISILSDLSDEKFSFLIFISVFMLVLFSFALYFNFYIKVKKLKQFEKWEEQSHAIHSTDLTIRTKDQSLPLFLLLLPLLVSFALITITYINYNNIPDIFPTHWNAKGEIDGWTEKTRLSVISLPLVQLGIQCLFLLIHFGMREAKVQLSIQDKKRSIQREGMERKYGSWYLAIINYAVTFLMSFLHYTTMIQQKADISSFNIVFIGFLIITFGGLILFVWKVSRSSEQFKQIHSNETAASDDDHWKWGIFYMNKNDPSLFVQKKFGIGWTVNLGNKWCTLYILIIIFILILPIFT